MKCRISLGMVAVALLASCSPDDGKKSAPRPAAAPSFSNILAEDYVGPETCGRCHKENHARWKQHPHVRMNAMAGDDTVVGDFSGARLPYADGEAVFRKDDGRYLMEFFQKGKKTRAFRVTRTIGWRYLQEYIGIQTDGPEPAGDALYAQETRLKFGYALKDRMWLPKAISTRRMTARRSRKTAPSGTIRSNPSGVRSTAGASTATTRIPTSTGSTRPTGSRISTGAFRSIEALLQGRPALRDQLRNPTLPSKSLVTVGISCESCHFGGREHARDPKTLPRFVPTHPELDGWTPDPRNARRIPPS
jgi:hypothetical protein